MDRTGPDGWEVDAVLRDGHTVRIRSIRPSDAERIERFHERQSPESIYFRFFSPRPRLSERELRHFTSVDHHDRVAFVALVDDEVIAVARYERYEGTGTAEVAFFVDDRHHGRGIATLMLEYLAAAARDNGISRFRASTLPNNRKMLRVFAAAGYDVATHLDEGVVDVAFDLRSTGEVLAAVERREQVAQAASVRPLLHPGTVVVVDVEGDAAGPDALPVRAGFVGRVDHVVPDDLDGIRDGTDLAVVTGPAPAVPSVLDECGRRSVGAAIVATQADPDEVDLILEAARRHGLRVLGPGVAGVSNTDPGSSLHVMADAAMPLHGRIGMLVGDGDVVAPIVDHTRRVGLGISTLVASSSGADVDVADLLSYWAEDRGTAGVLLYLGQEPLPERFLRSARRASLSTPVAALRASTPLADLRLVQVRRCEDAAFRQSGVMAVGTLQELLAIGRVLADQPEPSGRGVAVVGTSDGAVALTVAACAAAGLEPVLRLFSSDDLGTALTVATSDPAVHALVVVDTSPGAVPPEGLTTQILAASTRRPDLTVVATTVGGERAVRLVDHTSATAVPVFTFPEHAAIAIARLAAAGEWRSTARVHGSESASSAEVDAARDLARRWWSDAEAEGSPAARLRLDHAQQEELLATVGLAVAPRRTVSSVDEAARAAAEIGWPVALKVRRRDRRKRTALGGVALDLAVEEDLRGTWARMEAALGADGMTPAVVQRLLEQGVDVGVQVRRTASGTTVEVGLGGPAAAFDPWELGLVPLTLADAGFLVSSSSVGRALTDPIERVPVVTLVHRLAALVEEVDEIESLRVDPAVVVGPDAWIADVEVVLAAPGAAMPVRHLG